MEALNTYRRIQKEGVTLVALAILDVVRSNPNCTTRLIHDETGVTYPNISRHLSVLKKRELVRETSHTLPRPHKTYYTHTNE